MYQYYGIVNDADCACRSDTSASASRALLRRLAGRPAGAAHAHGCVRAQEGNRSMQGKNSVTLIIQHYYSKYVRIVYLLVRSYVVSQSAVLYLLLARS